MDSNDEMGSFVAWQCQRRFGVNIARYWRDWKDSAADNMLAAKVALVNQRSKRLKMVRSVSSSRKTFDARCVYHSILILAIRNFSGFIYSKTFSQ